MKQPERPEQPERPDPHDPAGQEASGGGGLTVDQFIRMTLRQIRRLAILLVGLTVVLIGIVMLVTPGPALVVVPIGLAILAIEFAWARHLLKRVRGYAAQVRTNYQGYRDKR